MKIVQVDKKLINNFVDFPDELYECDANYVPYIKSDLCKTLHKLLLADKTYFALLAMDEGRTLGRVLCTVDRNKQLNTDKCGFFSMFECVHDQTVCDMLLGEATRRLKQMGATHLSGTYYPYDQDNRRGILVEGFDQPPLIFCSYNKPYYDRLLTGFGLVKHTDALQYAFDLQHAEYRRAQRIDVFARNRYNYRVDTVDWKHLDRDIRDFHAVMQAATDEVIYQDAPEISSLYNIVRQWRRFLDKDYILIARSNKDDAPLGIMMALPDYFELFAKMKGKTDARGLWILTHQRKKIHGLRAILQYVVPEYQNTGMIASLYAKLWQAMSANGVTRFEAGTIMERNQPSNEVLKGVGGVLARRYRIYYKEI